MIIYGNFQKHLMAESLEGDMGGRRRREEGGRMKEGGGGESEDLMLDEIIINASQSPLFHGFGNKTVISDKLKVLEDSSGELVVM